jgi:steroid 5-alpha reductase family enzyme
MDSVYSPYWINFFAVAVMMVAGWLISLRRDNVTVVDSLWGIGFVLIAWLTFVLSDGYRQRALLLAVLTTVWGLRLTLYLSRRNLGKAEDPRYTTWRRKYGDRFWIVSLFNVFLIQAVFLWVIALAMQYGQMALSPARLTWLDIFGTLIWLVGFCFEAVGDWQLARFKSDPANKGKVMDRGLWAYTRHPNYFGEAMVWWGVFLIALSTPGSLWTVVSPIVITITLLKITGVALTEKVILEKRPAYREYIAKTSSFFPWFPKRSHNECHDQSRRSGYST